MSNGHYAPPPGERRLPGSDGEHALQRRLGTERRAERFYDEQVLDHLNERMREFVARQEMFFLSTSDRNGECDCSFRAGPPGFLQVLDPRSLAYPEYRGNGVHASLGNISENPHAGLLLIDFERARIGLHVNGRARIVSDAELRAEYPHLPETTPYNRRFELWVRIEVEEAYIHCAKHIPQLMKAPRGTPRDWGTDDYRRKGGDFFGAARERQARRSHRPAAAPPVPAAPPARPDAPAVPAPVASPEPAGRPEPTAPPVAPAPVPVAQAEEPPVPPGLPAAPQAPSASVGEERGPAPAEVRPTLPAPPPEVQLWREQARRALERAERAGSGGGGWFG